MTTDAELARRRTVLLFYREAEADKLIPGDRYLKRVVRPLYNRLHHRQKMTGYGMLFHLLCKALRAAGCDVRVNDYALARRHPNYPVGIAGYPFILDTWRLPNPALLGPCLHDHPALAPDLFDDERFKQLLVLADWTHDMFAPYYGAERLVSWFAGIDLENWPDRSHDPTTLDFLVYDKVRWHRDELEPSLIEPVCRELERRGLSYKTVRYKFYDHDVYAQLLSQARGMVFLCEHETQGLAYQEAMASGVPILAWDPGFWVDPLWKRLSDRPPATASVPFFSEACGERFQSIDGFAPALDRFMARRDGYDPRAYVRDNLSPAQSARIYADAYFALAPAGEATVCTPGAAKRPETAQVA